MDRAAAVVGGEQRAASTRCARPAAPGPGRREPDPGRRRGPRTVVRVAHRAEPDRRPCRPLAAAGSAARTGQRRVVRAGELPRRLGAFHDDRRRGQSLVGRRGDRRGQPQVHLGGDLRDQGRTHRRRLRPRRPGTPRRPSGHQPGAARRRSPPTAVPRPARRHPRPARRGDDRPRRCGRNRAGGNGADPQRGLERHRQAAAGRGLRAALHGAAARHCWSPAPCWRPCWRGGWPSA